jgi:hypothetical protein
MVMNSNRNRGMGRRDEIRRDGMMCGMMQIRLYGARGGAGVNIYTDMQAKMECEDGRGR